MGRLRTYADMLRAKENLETAAEMINFLYEDRARIASELYDLKLEREKDYLEILKLQSVLRRIARSGIETNETWAWIQGIAKEALEEKQ